MVPMKVWSMNVPAKFEVRSFTRAWDNRRYLKTLGIPEYAHAPFSPHFKWVFVRMDHVNVPAKF